MHTTEKLALALEEAKLHEMAKVAREGFYHDFLSPLATPCMQLEADLRSQHTDAAEKVRQRHLNGEFDATSEESEDWAQSPDGQAAFGQLVKRGH